MEDATRRVVSALRGGGPAPTFGAASRLAPATPDPHPGGPMASSKAATVEEYLQELPEDRRQVVSALRDHVRRHLPEGYEETMSWGMISWEIPLSRYPQTYNKQPLGYAALAAQKSYFALYMMGPVLDGGQDAWIREAFRKAGKKLDMGKSCIRFRSLDDLPLDALGEAIASTPPDAYIAAYEASRGK